MNTEAKSGFSHDKKTSFFLAFSFLSSVIITSMPLFLMKFIALETSLYLMFFVEFAFAAFVYITVLRHFSRYKITPELNPVHIKKILILSVLIVLIQVSVFLYDINIYHSQPTRWDFFSLVTLTFIIPVYEEVFYRGCLFGFICSLHKKSLILPGAITSLIFCAMHTQYASFFYQTILFIISSILLYIRIETKSLFYPIILHSGMNAFVVFLNMQSFYR